MPYPPQSSWTPESPARPSGLRLGILHALEGLSKLGLLSLRVTLQGLVFLDEILELLLDLADPGLLLLARGAFLGRFVFGLGQHLLKGHHFGRGPYQSS